LEDIDTVTLDTWSLNITKISYSLEEDEEMQDCESKLGEETEIGSRLDITLPQKVKQGQDFNIIIEYSTSPNSKALSWLKSEQTLDKECPFLFSQSEPIYGRAIFPCQDTPSIKFPYVAHVSVKSPMTVLLSADIINQYTEGENNVFDFEMKMPIPSYLVAVLVGKLDFRKIGERCGVYAEPSFVDKCAQEFEDMEKFLKVGEEILFEYPLNNYFVAFLPPSMPYGGMENPIVTYATPTIVVGDKSAVNVVCHEITHSWTGNYLTNSSWEDFWLNEGFTRYIEAKMIHRIYGDDAHKMHLKEGLANLEAVLQNKTGKGSGCILVPHIPDYTNPDDVLGITQYEKGHYFLYHLEKLVTEEHMLVFLRSYLKKREGGNINTREFVSDFIDFVKSTFDAEKSGKD
jgi:leukotriene-A4 hydrolase